MTFDTDPDALPCAACGGPARRYSRRCRECDEAREYEMERRDDMRRDGV